MLTKLVVTFALLIIIIIIITEYGKKYKLIQYK
jgi:hypothetical protein